MRKIIAIFFLSLFLLYHVGYIGYYWYSLKQIDLKYRSLVSYDGPVHRISIPISLPYWNDQQSYAPTYGKLVIDGKIYRKVLQKYAKDAIHLVLVEDRLTKKLNHSLADWLNTMNGANSEQSVMKSVVKDFLFTDDLYFCAASCELADQQYFSYHYKLLNRSSDVITPPPQV